MQFWAYINGRLHKLAGHYVTQNGGSTQFHIGLLLIIILKMYFQKYLPDFVLLKNPILQSFETYCRCRGKSNIFGQNIYLDRNAVKFDIGEREI